jgi:hypothetical protein
LLAKDSAILWQKHGDHTLGHQVVAYTGKSRERY